jgi:hypothetical protein
MFKWTGLYDNNLPKLKKNNLFLKNDHKIKKKSSSTN